MRIGFGLEAGRAAGTGGDSIRRGSAPALIGRSLMRFEPVSSPCLPLATQRWIDSAEAAIRVKTRNATAISLFLPPAWHGGG